MERKKNTNTSDNIFERVISEVICETPFRKNDKPSQITRNPEQLKRHIKRSGK